ncbi:MAG TPA: hypothetical protein VGR97_09840 [Candidatus Acidoferrales bacterium]|nr:hypothetical protein [Candidatus Acidoferrales bacterium]
MNSKRNAIAVSPVAFCMVAAILASCRPHDIGPRLIEADGASYTACGGVLSMLDDSNQRDPETWSYDVRFTDARGVNHELKSVRNLKITSLPPHSAACRALH